MSEKKGGKSKSRSSADEPRAIALVDSLGKASLGSGSVRGLASAAATNGRTPSDVPLAKHCTSLINLEVKVLTQALGAENQWVERGDGVAEFADFTIRVVAPKSLHSPSSPDASPEGSPDGGASFGADGSPISRALGSEEVTVLLEDTITSETPFVGENCCIVWNSFDQQLSLCLMYASESGYAASWSALVALQDKAYPPLQTDLLSQCLPVNERRSSQRERAEGNDEESPDGSGGEHVESCATTAAAGAETGGGGASPQGSVVDKDTDGSVPPGVLPYSYYIHDKYDPPLGFIERHALSLCIIERGHASRKELYEDRETVLTLLSLANADLLEHLVSRDVYPLLLGGLDHATDSDVEDGWSVPSGLTSLTVPDELTQIISKDLRLAHLQQRVLVPVDSFTDLLMRLSTISHRLRSELTCSLLSSDVTLQQAREALMVSPPITAGAAAVIRRRQSSDSGALTGSDSGVSGSSAVVDSCVQAEQQVLAHLHFFRSLVSLSLAELGKELVGPVVVKVFQSSLLEALSLVAERFAMPCGVAQPFAGTLLEGSGSSSANNHRGHTTALGWYSPAVEAELTMLLDVTLVRLNERREEQLMNELVRTPILADPAKYNGLMTFMLRQLVLGDAGVHPCAASAMAGASTAARVAGRPCSHALSGSSAASRSRVLHESMTTRNPYILFHVLGLHDDEGSAAAERALDPESTEIRNRFHSFVITRYLFQASRGSLVPVPQPPAAGACVHKGSPIIPFSHPAVAQSLPQGMSPSFIRVLEYLIALSTTENREALLRIVFNHKSNVMQYIESCCELAMANPRSIGIDVLSTCMRFLRTVISQIAVPESHGTENPMALFAIPSEPIGRNLVTTMCRQLTVERDTFGIILRTYQKIGGTRRNTIFHSAVLSLLELIDHRVPAIKDSGDADDLAQMTNDLRDIRDYLFFKHITILPTRFERKFRESLLSEVSSRLGRDPNTPNGSVSVLSSTASEMLRSSSRLRFVDEVEAATGGVDGTVVPESVSNLSPVVVGNVHSSEEKLTKKLRSTMELLGGSGSGAGSGGHLRGGAGGSPGPSPQSIRPHGGGSGGSSSSSGGSSPIPFRNVSPALVGSLSIGQGTSGVHHQLSPPAMAHVGRQDSGSSAPAPGNVSGSVGRLNPMPPSYEKTAVRPRSARAGGESSSESTRAGSAPGGTPDTSSLESSPQGAMSAPASVTFSPQMTAVSPTVKPSAVGAGGSPSGSGEVLVLPKIRKRAAAVNSRR